MARKRLRAETHEGVPCRNPAQSSSDSASDSKELDAPKTVSGFPAPILDHVPSSCDPACESKEEHEGVVCYGEIFDASDGAILIGELNKSVYARSVDDYDPRVSRYPELMRNLLQKGVDLRILEMELCVVAESCSIGIVLYHDDCPASVRTSTRRQTFEVTHACSFIAQLNSSMRERLIGSYDSLESSRYTHLFGSLRVNVKQLHCLTMELSALLSAAMCAA